MRKCLAVLSLLFAALPVAHADSTPHWVEVRSDHFDVITDSTEKQARHLAGQFERMRSLFHTLLPKAASDASSPIVVLALKDRKGFTALEPAPYLAKGALQLDGLFLRTMDNNYILVRLDGEGEHPFSTVYHEYTHFVLRKADWIPLWLSEGLAEFYQNTDIEEKDVLLGQPSGGDIEYLRQNRLLPLKTLLAVDHSSPYYHDEQKGSVFYAESWALTHYIIVNDRQKGTTHFQEYSKLLIQEQDPVTAAQQAFGDLGKLESDLNRYIQGDNFKMFRLNASFTQDESSFKARPISSDQANAVRADVLANVQRPAEAKALIDTILKDDPHNALAHETMGEMSIMEHDIPAAKKSFGEAVQSDSTSYVANYYYAMMSLQEGDRGIDDSIEACLKASIKLEPTFAPAYDALASFYAVRREKLDEAHMLSLQAIQIEPEQISYRINAANVYMQRSEFANAVNILEAALKHAKQPADVAILQGRLAEVKRYRDAMAQSSQIAASRSVDSPGADAVTEGRTIAVPVDPSTKDVVYPSPAADAPHRTTKGVIHNVKCAYPTVLTLELAQQGKALFLVTNNYFKVVFTTANYTPTGSIDPCKVMEGMKAKIDFAELTGSEAAGQIVSIELSK